ncbi:AAA family ATPase [Lentzea sp. NPDC059081]|uniref:AAA family ATPase n=1 Tax=Lentzea sp. NPDC059081 TaxID=3346719 RepID=UPI0036849C61
MYDIDLAQILPPPPPWRNYGGALPASDGHPPEDDGEAIRRLGSEFHLTEQHIDPHELDMVNASLYLRRPLLLTGKPGVGKSALAYRIARELRLGRVLKWSISTHTTLSSGLYRYDSIGRLQAAASQQQSAETASAPIGDFLHLGPLGTAFLPRKLPRVLLIDELDKSESDLPNNLLSIFEDGEFVIDELARVRHSSREMTVHTADPNETATVTDGRVRCHAFPIVIMTSNGEREFPPAFLRRALQLEIKDPNVEQLAAMVANHLLDPDGQHSDALVREFVEKSRAEGGIPADRLLDAVFLATSGAYKPDGVAWPRLIDSLWHRLTTGR